MQNPPEKTDSSIQSGHSSTINFLAQQTTFTRSAVLNRMIDQSKALYLDFSQTAFICVQHLIPQTPELIKALLSQKARSENIFLLGKLYSTDHTIPEKIIETGIHLVKTIPDEYKGGEKFSEVFTRDLIRLMTQFRARLKESIFEKVIILDDGGRCVSQFFLHANHPCILEEISADTAHPPEVMLQQICQSILADFIKRKIKIASVEQTSVGVDTAYEELSQEGMKLPFPLIMMASTVAKRILETGFIAAQLREKLESEIFDTRDEEITIGILGCGKIGSSVSKEIISIMSHIEKKCTLLLFDTSEASLAVLRSSYRDLEAQGRVIFVKTCEELLRRAHYIIGCTGRDTFYEGDIGSLIDKLSCHQKKTFVSCSSENKEFFSLISFLRNHGLSSNKDKHPLSDLVFQYNNIELKFLYSGYPFNFSGKEPGVRLENIQGTLALLYGGLIQAFLLATFPNMKPYERGFFNLFIYDIYIQQYIIKTCFEFMPVFANDAPSVLNVSVLHSLHELSKLVSLDSKESLESKMIQESQYPFSKEKEWSEAADRILSGISSNIKVIKTCFEVKDFSQFVSQRINKTDSAKLSEQQTLIKYRTSCGIFSKSKKSYPVKLQIVLLLGFLQDFFNELKHPISLELLNFMLRKSGFHDEKQVVQDLLEAGILEYVGHKVVTISEFVMPFRPSQDRFLPSLAEVLHDNHNGYCSNPGRFHFWDTRASTIASLGELSSASKAIIQQGKEIADDQETLLAMIELGFRYGAFAYRTGLLEQALGFLSQAEFLISLGEANWKFSEELRCKIRNKKGALERHQFNCYLLQRDFERFGCMPAHVHHLVSKETVQSFIQSEKASRLDKAVWLWERGEKEQSIQQHLEVKKKLETEQTVNGWPYIVALINLNLGEIYMELNKDKEAEPFFEEALKYYAENFSTEISVDSATTLWEIGKLKSKVAQREEGFHTAKEVLLEARQMFVDMQFADDNIFIVRIDREIAAIEHKIAEMYKPMDSVGIHNSAACSLNTVPWANTL